MIHVKVFLGLAVCGSFSGCKAQVTAPRARSSSIQVCLSKPGEAHPENFTYRQPPAQRKGPSLRQGWILGRNLETPERGFEALLSEVETKDEANDTSPPLEIHGEHTATDGDAFFFETIRPSVNTFTEASQQYDGPAVDVTLQLYEARQTFAAKPAYVRGPRVDKKSFIRVYYISALRVPASESWDLVYDLKEYLLNWSGINNIGRVAGDDIDPDLGTLLTASTERKTLKLLPGVRAAAFEEPNLNVRKARSKQSVRGKRKDNVVHSTILELVTHDEGDRGRASGDGFPRWSLEQKWNGPTRLLLLDEMHAGKKIDALPLPLQAVCAKFGGEPSNVAPVLVKCRLTIFYEYWSLDEVLWELLPEQARFPVTFSRIGHVAELHLHREQIQYRHLIAQVALDKNKPAVRSVVFRKIALQGNRYVVEVELLAGTTSLVTTGWENGVPFRVSIASVIWDARLCFERQRLIDQFFNTDVLFDVNEVNLFALVGSEDMWDTCQTTSTWTMEIGAFETRQLMNITSITIVVEAGDICAGVGLVAIPASLKVRRVYANDANPDAYNCLAKNVVDNNVSGQIEISNKDIRSFLSSIFDAERPLPVTQLLMSHPVDVELFLELLRGAFDRITWPLRSLPRIHVYSICKESEDELEFSTVREPHPAQPWFGLFQHQ